MIAGLLLGAGLTLFLVWAIGTINVRAEQRWLNENAQMVRDLGELPPEAMMLKYGWNEHEYELQRQVAMNYLRWEVYG